MSLDKSSKELNWDKIMQEIYDYTFFVDCKQFLRYKKANFKGTYIVKWDDTYTSKELI